MKVISPSVLTPQSKRVRGNGEVSELAVPAGWQSSSCVAARTLPGSSAARHCVVTPKGLRSVAAAAMTPPVTQVRAGPAVRQSLSCVAARTLSNSSAASQCIVSPSMLQNCTAAVGSTPLGTRHPGKQKPVTSLPSKPLVVRKPRLKLRRDRGGQCLTDRVLSRETFKLYSQAFDEFTAWGRAEDFDVSTTCALGLEALKITPHTMRHRGPSHNRYLDKLSLQETIGGATGMLCPVLDVQRLSAWAAVVTTTSSSKIWECGM